ncbi:p-hydroxyphenylacetate 3-hydroxylase, reductase component [Anaplasma platys]|uniref:p-hydroxyphenylacetate 3-hydroxylase, reductase component n=1 Tax=Anaplasma platys TaxID=949 RepID=A0A858PXT6_9RICK|nr:flavin reductase family protein [Anaplasma platys]QJC27378.1 p-hydroxyphenylacetate 3-hydroxylase, reductase component [Anaplasma platys]
MQLESVPPGRFRSCVGRFVTGVTVVTTTDTSGGRCGITVSSFNSVSLDPPLVLFSVQRTASRFQTFTSCSGFVVNILGDKQKDVSQDFADRSAEHWEKHSFTVHSGIPVVCGALAYFRCALYNVYDGGDHKIVVGRVLDCDILEDTSPLLYYRGKYWVIGKEL